MRTRIQKWGNSLAVRIPKPFAEEANLSENAPVEVTVRSGKLVVALVAEPELSLADLVSRITPRNRHHETGTGGAAGNEAW
jgi:antitoxin MazE